VKTKIHLAALLTALALGVAACGGDDGEDAAAEQPAATETTETTPEETGLDPKFAGQPDREAAAQEAREAALADAEALGGATDPPTGKKIAYIHLSAQAEASQRVHAGLEEIAGLFDFELIVCDPNFDPARVAQCATSLVAQNPDIVITEAADPGAAGAGLREANRRGIPWITTGAGQTPSEFVTAEYVPDERTQTQFLDEWFFETITGRFGDEEAKIISFQASPVGPAVRARDERRKEDLEDYPSIQEIVAHEIDLSNPAQDVINTTKTTLEQNPGLAGIWQTCDFCVPLNAQAVDSLGLQGDDRPVIAGIYSGPETRQRIAEGSIDGVVENNFEVMGWVAMDQALEHWARDRDFHPDNSVFTEGYSIDLLVPWIMTEENVGDDFNVINNQGEDYRTYFLTKWNAEFGTDLP
jgi:ABC-type sugar transport system substrate-binding protein